MVAKKPSSVEDEYFAREEAEKLHRLHTDKVKSLSAQEQEAQKKLHWMRCPKCGYELQTLQWRDVEIEKCFSCGAIVLDDGELEKLAGGEDDESFMSTVFNLFRNK